jgi:cation:H+ antiporter
MPERTAAGAVLPRVATAIADQMGWSNTFGGLRCVRHFGARGCGLGRRDGGGLVDMAVANLLGSNLFDVAIVALDDLAYTRGPILNDVSQSHAVTATSAAVMSAIAIVGLTYRPTGRLFRRSSWVGAALFSLYLLNLIVQFLFGD